ncbi:hypothetical protein EON64_11895 [archaeon]|nr:MAG: hypothetical protein EON64_11895 [archaeon]
MNTATTHEVVSELFLATSADVPHANLALGGQDAEEIVLSKSGNKDTYHKNYSSDADISQHSALEISDNDPLFVPNIWTWDYIGLYCQYASVGLLYGSSGTYLPFCAYIYDGASNTCANARNIVNFAWSFKLFFAMLTDCVRPFGMRRKPWMLGGWVLVLIMLFVLSFIAESLNVSIWLVLLMLVQCFMMFSDVPAGKNRAYGYRTHTYM